jgi:hypothetical protein
MVHHWSDVDYINIFWVLNISFMGKKVNGSSLIEQVQNRKTEFKNR